MSIGNPCDGPRLVFVIASCTETLLSEQLACHRPRRTAGPRNDVFLSPLQVPPKPTFASNSLPAAQHPNIPVRKAQAAGVSMQSTGLSTNSTHAAWEGGSPARECRQASCGHGSATRRGARADGRDPAAGGCYHGERLDEGRGQSPPHRCSVPGSHWNLNHENDPAHAALGPFSGCIRPGGRVVPNAAGCREAPGAGQTLPRDARPAAARRRDRSPHPEPRLSELHGGRSGRQVAGSLSQPHGPRQPLARLLRDWQGVRRRQPVRRLHG